MVQFGEILGRLAGTRVFKSLILDFQIEKPLVTRYNIMLGYSISYMYI